MSPASAGDFFCFLKKRRGSEAIRKSSDEVKQRIFRLQVVRRREAWNILNLYIMSKCDWL